MYYCIGHWFKKNKQKKPSTELKLNSCVDPVQSFTSRFLHQWLHSDFTGICFAFLLGHWGLDWDGSRLIPALEHYFTHVSYSAFVRWHETNLICKSPTPQSMGPKGSPANFTVPDTTGHPQRSHFMTRQIKAILMAWAVLIFNLVILSSHLMHKYTRKKS